MKFFIKEQNLNLLELKLDEIEFRLYGVDNSKISADSNRTWPYFEFNLLKMLFETEQKLLKLTVSRNNFNKTFNKLKNLQKWLLEDDNFESLLSTLGNQTSIVKFEEILAFEEEIRLDSERILQLSKLNSSLENDTNLDKVVELEPRLSHLKLELAKMQHYVNLANQSSENLITKYTLWY